MSSPLSDTAQANGFFSHYPVFWEMLRPTARLHQRDKGEAVFYRGDNAHTLWLIQKGWTRLTRQTPDGKETVLGICTQDDVFGEAALFEESTYPYTAEVLDGPAELISIPADRVRQAMRENTALSLELMQHLNERSARTQVKLEQMSTMSATQRLGCFLLGMSRSLTDENTLHIPVEKHVIATYLGMKPETLSRSQQQLKNVGVSIQGANVKIDNLDGLREFVCSSCSQSGDCRNESSEEEDSPRQ